MDTPESKPTSMQRLSMKVLRSHGGGLLREAQRLRQREHHNRIVPAHRLRHRALGDGERAAGHRLALAGIDQDVLLAVYRIADRAGHDHATEHALPQDLTSVGVERAEAAVEVAPRTENGGRT